VVAVVVEVAAASQVVRRRLHRRPACRQIEPPPVAVRDVELVEPALAEAVRRLGRASRPTDGSKPSSRITMLRLVLRASPRLRVRPVVAAAEGVVVAVQRMQGRITQCSALTDRKAMPIS
jgi:hypothetical protein